MKLNKLFAGVLAAAMMMTIGVSAMAVTTTSKDGDNSVTIDGATYYDESTIGIKKSYKLVGEGTSPAEEFELTQIGNGTVEERSGEVAPALTSIAKASFAAGEAKSENATTKEFIVTLPEYTRVGTYVYTLKETAKTTAGVTYYSGTITLKVQVVNGSNGALRIAAVHTEANGQNKSDTFQNTYTANKLNITKTVTGTSGDKNKYFEFTVELQGEEGKTYAESFTVSGGSYESNPKTIEMNKETKKGSGKVYLKDGETITVENLPAGVTYTVTETDYSSEGYTTTSLGMATRTVSGTINGFATSMAAFVNTKGTTVDTGVILDNAPYIVMLAVVAGGVVFMMSKKHREE